MYLSGTLFLVTLLCLQGSCTTGYNDHDTVNHETGQSMPIDNAMSGYSASHVESEQDNESSTREKKIAEQKARRAVSNRKYHYSKKKGYEYNDKLAEKDKKKDKT